MLRVTGNNFSLSLRKIYLAWYEVESEASDQQSEDTRREKIAKNDSHSEEFSPEKALDCQIGIDELKKRIKDLEERREVEKFGVRRFMASDSDII